MISEKYLARRFFGTQQSLESGDVDIVYSVPGLGNPADGLTKLESDMVPLIPLQGSVAFRPSNSTPV